MGYGLRVAGFGFPVVRSLLLSLAPSVSLSLAPSVSLSLAVAPWLSRSLSRRLVPAFLPGPPPGPSPSAWSLPLSPARSVRGPRTGPRRRPVPLPNIRLGNLLSFCLFCLKLERDIGRAVYIVPAQWHDYNTDIKA